MQSSTGNIVPLRKSRVIDSDYYKSTQPRMYHPDVTGIFSYAESRGGSYPEVVFFGLQGFIKEKLLVPVTKQEVDYADRIITAMGVTFFRDAWDIVVDEYNGYLPFTIKAVKEGSVTPNKNAIVTVECLDSRCYSLVGYLETALLRAVWFPTTIASRARSIKKGIDSLYTKYADSKATSAFAFLDFSARGVESQDASEIGSAAFLTSFLGTDTIAGVAYLYDLYGAEINGFSVAATEHSVMCSWEESNEFASFEKIVNDTPNGAILSVVSDTWNIYRACEYWCRLAKVIEDKNITLVVRPDSGEPEKVLPAMFGVLENGYDTVKNDKGLKVFKNLKVLWGDGIDEENILDVLMIAPNNGFGVENLILGSGGGLMQKVNRDTMKFAFKASAVEKHKAWVPIAKNPITDPGKKSKSGKLELVRDRRDGEIKTVDWSLVHAFGESLLETVYKYDPKEAKGVLVREQTFKEIRELAA